MSRQIVKPLVRPLVSAIIKTRKKPGFTPLSMFLAGEQGAWYDPSDLTTLFQDAAGTTPVTAAGQPVGLMRDKSGRGNHASQSVAASRPVLRNSGALWRLEFDGVDDFLVTGAINFTATNKMSVFVGARKLSDAARAMLVELSDTAFTNNGAFSIEAPNDATPTYLIRSRGSIVSLALASGFPAPTTNVLAGILDIAGDVAIIRVNGAQAGSSVGDQGTGSYGSYPLYIGCRAGSSLPWAGYLDGLILHGATTDAAGVAAAEKYMAGKSGVVI